MKLLLASPRGFCAGVNMAIQCLETALQRFGPPVYVYHEIVHNKHVVEGFRRRGAVFVDTLDEVPPDSHLLFSAHGVSPEVRRQADARRLQTIDAGCPLVMKVHHRARRLAEQGYRIVLIGHPGHDEVVGTMGEAPKAMTLVADIEQVDKLEFPPDAKLACLTQTTLSVESARRIIDRLCERFPSIEVPSKDDICYATQNRQQAVRTLAGRAQVVLVLGSANSSNSRRLQELAREQGVPAYLIDDAGHIDPAWFRGDETVLITAGASAPEWVVEQCVAFLSERFGAAVETCPVCDEQMRFPIPLSLRSPADGVADSDAS